MKIQVGYKIRLNNINNGKSIKIKVYDEVLKIIENKIEKNTIYIYFKQIGIVL